MEERTYPGPRKRFGLKFGERRGFEKPVKEDETYDVTIEKIGEKGDGMVRIDNFVVFVPGTKEGDKVKIRITQVMRRFAIAEVVGEAEEKVEEPKAEEAPKVEEGSEEF